MKSEVATVAVMRDASIQRPIPSVWRDTFVDIVNALASGNCSGIGDISAVLPLADDTKTQIEGYLAEYPAKLLPLPPETWETSVCIWMGEAWEVLVDLWTIEEGASDLVLKATVFEDGVGFRYQVQMVYVP